MPMSGVFKRVAVLCSALLIVAGISSGTVVHALDGTSFNQNNILSDALIDNVNSMSAAEIDAFLNTFPDSCISSNSGFGAIDPIGYNPNQGFLYGATVTAGTVIYDAAHAYEINPQVLISMLQLEQSLVQGNTGCGAPKYAAAMGYGCPDGASIFSYSGLNLYSINSVPVTSVNNTCVNSAAKAGFSQQVIHTAWLLKFGEQRSEGNTSWAVIKNSWDNSDDLASCYGGPMTQGFWQRCPIGSNVFYDGYMTIDNTTVHIDNGATAALYWYTPHFAGNRNLFTIMNNWFLQPLPTVTLLVNGQASATVDYGSSVTLTWSSTNATACTVMPGTYTDLANTITLNNLTESKSYTITCTGSVGSAGAQAQITVSPPTYDYIQRTINSLGSDTNIKILGQLLTNARKFYDKGDTAKATQTLNQLKDAVTKLVSQQKVPQDSGNQLVKAINDLIAAQ
jgi:hypothetical protein